MYYFRLLSSFCTSLLLLGLSSNWVSAQEIVHLLTIEEFDHNGKEVPLAKDSIDLLSYIEKNQNIRFDVKRVPWKRAMNNALTNDILLMGMTITSERARKYIFSDAINASGNWLITRCDKSFKFDGLQDLKGKLIGVVIGTSAGEDFDRQTNKLFRVENDIAAGISRLQKLMANRMDALVWYGVTNDMRTMQEIINLRYAKQDFPNNTDSSQPFCVLPKALSIVSNHFAMRINPQNKIY